MPDTLLPIRTVEGVVLVKGTLRCLHCGHSSGEWAGLAGAPLFVSGIRTTLKPIGDAAVARCGRCHGPVYLDEATAVRSLATLRRIRRLRRQLAELEAARRSRPAA